LQELRLIIELGFHHEQQHQELILTDIKHVFSMNPLFPVYRPLSPSESLAPPDLTWRSFPKGLYSIGHGGPDFAFDNESPRHIVYVDPFRIASRLVTNREYLAFMEDGGYENPTLWLSDGTKAVEQGRWSAPAYWHRIDGSWNYFTLNGLRPVDWNEPMCHVSYYEADAYARWARARLPTEAEWEIAAEGRAIHGNFADDKRFHPRPVSVEEDLAQMFGDVWQWTQSPYVPYPGYRPAQGAIGEYNGKFMCNQMVLRGGSCATSRSHIRPTYRNFFPPEARWQFTGICLAHNA
jgi:ergothioneine biosynthesis protein EgtB